MTTLAEKYHTAPIKIAKAFPLASELGVIVMDVSPGLLEGDRYDFSWHAEAGSSAFITNQSYTKIHPCLPEGGASMRQTFELGEGAVIEHMPEPIMLYKDARFSGETIVRLSPGAVWMQAEVLCPGRTLRGEQFQYRELRSSLSVYYEDELIFAQRQLIDPVRQRLAVPGCWEEMTHTATFYLFSDRNFAVLLDAVKERLESLPSFGPHRVAAGASATFRHGIAVVAASTAAWPLQQAMRLVWDVSRQVALGRQPSAFLRS
ncbi:urease accessory protein UreD [Paenibacillus sp. NPDC058071]|uniref:urease accessory protein UreD n=1 Tax=Paenibacillus sp. NPDC058071 TaxID=3346326 RepID=UPI0036DCA9F5